MTESNKCKAEIQQFKERLSTLRRLIKKQEERISITKAEQRKMQDKIKEENGGWLIPDFVKNKRIKHLQEQLDKLKRSEASENYVLQDLINNHDSIVKEYNNKISLLHGPRRATIQKITIKAYGNW